MSEKPTTEPTLELGDITRVPKPSNTSIQLSGRAISGLSFFGNPMIPGDFPFIGLPDTRAMAAHAMKTTQAFPTIWFVNFPPTLPAQQKEQLQKLMEDMMDYRSWASLQWWREVFRRYPGGITADPQVLREQSRELARVACDMIRQDSCLQQTIDTHEKRNINCRMADFHTNLILVTMTGFVQLDKVSIQQLEPVLLEIVGSMGSVSDFQEVRTLVMEKYEYVGGGSAIKADIRFISFEITESFYEVKNGKNSTERWINCNMGFTNYEALFNRNKWLESSAGMDAGNSVVMKEFVNKQSFAIRL